MPRAAKQARRPLQLSGLAYSSVWEAKNSSETAPHPHRLFTSDTIILHRGCNQYFPPGAKGGDMLEFFFFFPSNRTFSKGIPWSIS